MFVNCRLLIILLVLCLAAPASAANLTFTWVAPTTNADGSTPVNLAGYRIYYRIPPAAFSSFVDVGKSLTGTVTGLTADTLYYFAVVGYNGANELGAFSQEVGNFTGPTTPTAPSALRLVAMTCHQVELRWNPAFDDLGVTEYRVRRGGAQIATTAGSVRLYTDGTANPSTAYTYVVRAADASANESSDSNSVVATTPACP